MILQIKLKSLRNWFLDCCYCCLSLPISSIPTSLSFFRTLSHVLAFCQFSHPHSLSHRSSFFHLVALSLVKNHIDLPNLFSPPHTCLVCHWLAFALTPSSTRHIIQVKLRMNSNRAVYVVDSRGGWGSEKCQNNCCCSLQLLPFFCRLNHSFLMSLKFYERRVVSNYQRNYPSNRIQKRRVFSCLN